MTDQNETPEQWAERVWVDAHCCDDTHRTEVVARVKAEVVAELARVKRERDEAVGCLARLLRVVNGLDSLCVAYRVGKRPSEKTLNAAQGATEVVASCTAFLSRIGGPK